MTAAVQRPVGATNAGGLNDRCDVWIGRRERGSQGERGGERGSNGEREGERAGERVTDRDADSYQT